MHHSRLAGFIIDCETDDLDAAAEFWSKALGYATSRSDDPAESDYVMMETPDDEIHIEIQKVSHASRLHLDIEADDIEAEVDRLEKLGAKRIAKVRRWWVMEAPTGQRFCVVHPVRRDFESKATAWDE
ncbi:MAG: VOC family protein [Gammaproteobacteria bacterium]|nr:VOC family protein [Gammaproteobacteria bacterium]